MRQGWIKIHRALIDNEIYMLPPLYLRVFERLILEANHEDNEIPYKKNGVVTTKLIKRGERLTNVRQIGEWVSWYERGCLKIPNPKLIKEVLDYLVKQQMIFIYDYGNRTETHYKIVNYDVYQDKEGLEVTEKKQNRNGIETELKQLAPQNKNDKNDKNVKNDKKYIYSSDSIEFRLSSYLFRFIQNNNSKAKEPNFQTWSRTFDLILRVDKRDLEEVKAVIKWCQTDSFWFKNILSPDKLRKQYDKLYLQMKNNKSSKPDKSKGTFNNYDQRTDYYSNIIKNVENAADESLDRTLKKQGDG